MKLSDFDYHLPEELIAQYPPEQRAGGRLLDVTTLMQLPDANDNPAAGTALPGSFDASAGQSPASPQTVTACTSPQAAPTAADRLLADLPELIAPGSLLVFNDTRVIHARLAGRKESGGRIEVMVERIDGEHEVLAMVRASHPPKAGSRLYFGPEDATEGATVVSAREPGSMMLRIRFDAPAAGVLERLGELPLPPYIQHQPDQADEARYQTVFAREPGAVAAPTAGLHFDEALLAALQARGIESAHLTLHVGAGTFLPVRTEDLSQHHMHSERYTLSPETAQAIARAKAEGRPVVAIGTTALRALEASGGVAGSGETDLFITPGYRFRVVDRLFTNFHLPKSTLLILVSAFAGRETIRRAYAHAIAQRYRFFSYGDAMLLDRAPVEGDA